MAFGKKKDGAPAEDVDEIEAEDDAAEMDMDAADEAADEGTEPAPEPIAAAPAAPAAGGTDALLSMFQESKEQVDDLGVLIALAGETDLDDILEELRTIRAALGITDVYEDETELAAAA